MAVYDASSTTTPSTVNYVNDDADDNNDNNNSNKNKNSNISFILLSKNAKKKAQRSMRISLSEEIFRTVLDAALKVIFQI